MTYPPSFTDAAYVSLDADEDDEFDEIPKPPKKKKQAEVTDFFSKPGPSGAAKKPAAPRKISQSMKPASPPKAKKAPPKIIDNSDDDDEMNYDDLPKPPPRTAGPSRAARAVAKKYVEILSDEDGGEDGSDFNDD